MMRRFFIPSLLLMAAAIFLALTLGTRSDEAERGFLSGLISRALSTPTTTVSIGSVEGALSSDATIRNITISDKEGIWFRLDEVRLIWRRLALLSRRLEIDKLEIGKLEILRRPIASAEAVPGDNQPILPELPVKVQIVDFLLKELVLGEPLIGVAARLTASGSASLGDPKEGLKLVFDARRLDAEGTVAARLNYATENLDLSLAVNEPAGGILARSANIPGLPPVKLDLAGTGTLDAFGAKLTFAAGPTIGASGDAILRRQGGVRRLTLDLNAQIEGLLPSLVAPVFAGTTELDGETEFKDDGSLSIQKFSIASQSARLDASGNLSADQVVDFKLSAKAVPNDQQKTVAGSAEIKSLAFNGTVTGKITAPQIEGQLNANEVSLPAGRLGALAATFTVAPDGPLSEKTTRIAVKADLEASGVALTDPALSPAIGDRLAFTVRANVTPDGVADIEVAKLSGQSVTAEYSGQLGADDSTGALTVRAPDLSRFGKLASIDLRGALDLSAQIQGLMSKAVLVAEIDGKVTRFATGIDPVDGWSGGHLALSGTVRAAPTGGFGFRGLEIKGQHGAVTVNGDAASNRIALNAAIVIDELRSIDKRLTGRGTVNADVSGTFEKPDAAFRAELRDATAIGRPVSQLALDATATDLLGLLDLRARLDGNVDGKAAKGSLQVQKRPDGGWNVDPLNVEVGSAIIRGSVLTDAAHLATGRLSIDARDLNDLSALVLMPLSGDVRAEFVLDATTGQQNVDVNANGSRIRVGEATIEKLTATASLANLYEKPVINAAVAADRVAAAGETFSQIRLDATGTSAASDIVLSAQSRGFDLDARGRLFAESPLRFELASFSARRDTRKIALARPATISVIDGGVSLQRLQLAIDGGVVSIDGRAGTTLDLRVAAKSVPLSVADMVAPGTGLSGTLDADAEIGGTAQAPTGNWRVRISRLVAQQTRGFNAPPLDITAQGVLSGGGTSVDGTINAGRAGTLQVKGRVPFDPARDLDVSATGRLDLAVANSYLSAEGRQVAGRVVIDLKIAGQMSEPVVNGAVSIEGGSFRDALQGIRLENIQARVQARGTDVVIERLTATTRNDGKVSVSGTVRVDPIAGFPGDIRITGQRAELVSSDLVTAVADLALSLSGPLAHNPRIAGQVRIVSMDVTVPERLPATVRPIAGTRHVKPPPIVAKRLAMEARARLNAGRAAAFDATLDLTLSAPSRVYVRGRGIDAELGGDLRLTGTLQNPVAIGAFELRRGRLTVIGTRLDFTRGLLTFTGDLTPELEFVAETNAGEVTARVSVSGSARAPQFTFSSDPDLPQDEVLSRILFSKASGGLSVTQALTLAQAAAQFSGGGSDDVFEQLRKSLGLQGLDISVGASGGPTVGISRAISDRVSVGVKAGASTEETGISVDIDVTRRIRVQGEVGADGSTSVGVGAEWEY